MIYKAVCLLAIVARSSAAAPASDTTPAPNGDTCYDIKLAYKNSNCCTSNLEQVTNYDIKATSDVGPTIKAGTNPCEGTKPAKGAGFDNFDCFKDGIVASVEQAGANVTLGYRGGFDTDQVPITTSYLEAGLCPVNVHWHLGAEHLSVGQYDQYGSGPEHVDAGHDDGGYARRKLAANPRKGFQCHHYKKDDPKFTTPFNWKHCVGMVVGETYEVHWPHSMAGDCGTPNQYQSPFYDGVFCHSEKLTSTADKIGVQGQVFTIVNDEAYYYPDLMRGWIVDGEMGKDITKYTGSTTGTSRNNEICSAYTPITWQVDRKCHMVSASSFDKMCADMKTQRDDMSIDLYAHGARELVLHELSADNQHHRKLGGAGYKAVNFVHN